MEMRPPSRMRRLSTKPSPGLPSSCDGGSAAIREDHFAGGAGAHAQLVFFLADAETRRVLFQNEGGNAVLRRRPVGDRHGDADIRIVRIGGERLAAVEHPVAVFAAPHSSACPPASDPASGSVSDQQPIHSPVASFGIYFCLLLVIASEINVIRAERIVRGDDERNARIDARQFLDDDGVFDVAEAGAAEFFRERWRPVDPSWPGFLITSSGKIWASSHSMTCGAISASAKSRTDLRSWICSAVNSKSIESSR